MLEAGKFSKMIFLDSALELDYLEKYLDPYVPPKYRENALADQTAPAPEKPDSQIDLNADDNINPDLFD